MTEGSRTELIEAPRQVVGDIGHLLVNGADEFLFVDPIRTNLSRYTSTGELVGAVGQFGEGPSEFGQPRGLVELADHRLVIADRRLARLTVFAPDLEPDTAFALAPRPLEAVGRLDDLLVVRVSGSRANGPLGRGDSYALIDSRWQTVASIAAPSPGTLDQYPYWNSFASSVATTSSEFLFAAYSFQYPVVIFDRTGNLVDSLSEPPTSFRQAPVLESGELAGRGSEERTAAWLSQFDVIAGLFHFQDSLLAVVHGQLGVTPAGVVVEHREFDIYRAPTRKKLAAGIRLPTGARVVAGGKHLVVLLASPPEPWTLARYEMNPMPARER